MANSSRLSGLSLTLIRPPPPEGIQSVLDVNSGVQRFSLDPDQDPITSFLASRSWRREAKYPTYSKSTTNEHSSSHSVLYKPNDPVIRIITQSTGTKLPRTELNKSLLSKRYHAPDGRPWWEQRIKPCGTTTWDPFLGKWTRDTTHLTTSNPSAFSTQDPSQRNIHLRQYEDLLYRRYEQEPELQTLSFWLTAAASTMQPPQVSNANINRAPWPVEGRIFSPPVSGDVTTPDTERSATSSVQANVHQAPLPQPQVPVVPHNSPVEEDDAFSWGDIELDLDDFLSEQLSEEETASQEVDAAQEDSVAQDNNSSQQDTAAVTHQPYSHQVFLAQNPHIQVIGQTLVHLPVPRGLTQNIHVHLNFADLPPILSQQILQQSVFLSLGQLAPPPTQGHLGKPLTPQRLPQAVAHQNIDRTNARQALASSYIAQQQRRNQYPYPHRFTHLLDPKGLIVHSAKNAQSIEFPTSDPKARLRVFKITIDALKAQIHNQYLLHENIHGLGVHLTSPLAVTSASTDGVQFEMTTEVWHWLIENVGDTYRGWFEMAWDRMMPYPGEEGYVACSECPVLAIEDVTEHQNASTDLLNPAPMAEEEDEIDIAIPDVRDEVVDDIDTSNLEVEDEDEEEGGVRLDDAVVTRINQTTY